MLEFVFTPGDNIKMFPLPIMGRYQLLTLRIEAESSKGFLKAIRKMRIYFRFDFGSSARCATKIYHLSNYVLVTEGLVHTIEFDDEFIDIDPKHVCTNASVSIQDEVYAPVIVMTLTMENIQL